jgi:hypothetical protein
MNLEQLTTINVDTTTITEISQLCNKLISQRKGLVVDQKEDIHWQTLRGFVKEQVEKGNAIPSDLFGLYVANRTKIKTNN